MFGEQRDTLNSLFRARIKQGAKIDSEAFAEHVRTRVVPCIEAVGMVLPERKRLATQELFEVSLDLFVAGHFGCENKSLLLSRLWMKHLPCFSMHLARDPRRVAGSLSNALIKIELHSNHIAELWLDQLARTSPHAESVDQLLIVGKAVAWLSGMSHFRASAIAAIRLLPAPLAAKLLEMPQDTSEHSIRDYLTNLELDPWCSMGVPNEKATLCVRQVGRCGSFRGFGGEMIRPPVVAANEGVLMVSDGQQVWQIFADPFGSTTQRIDASPFIENRKNQKQPQLTSDGCIHWNELHLQRPDLTNASSSAFDGRTFAVTIPTSFHVFLFARTASNSRSPLSSVVT